jgi:hypothetical protein
MARITFKSKIDGSLGNITSVVLEDSTGTYGIERDDTGAIVVAAGTPMTNTSPGVYSYVFTDVEGVSYTGWIKWTEGTRSGYQEVSYESPQGAPEEAPEEPEESPPESPLHGGMNYSPTDIANMALARIGSVRINDIETDASPAAIQCRLTYESDRDFLLERYWWTFAGSRATLARSTSDPAFEYDYKYALPNDFLCLRSIWDEGGGYGNTPYTCAIEGRFLLTDESAVSIRYTRLVTDPAEFDSLFIRLLKTQMALDMLYPLARSVNVGAADRLNLELADLSTKAKMMHLAQQNLKGRYERRNWIDARQTQAGVDSSSLSFP